MTPRPHFTLPLPTVESSISVPVRSSWASSTSHLIRSPTAGSISIRSRRRPRRWRWRLTAPTSSTSAASRRVPGRSPSAPRPKLRAIQPVIGRLSRSLKIPISIDTSKSAVAEVAIGEGASLINDVTGLRYDASLAEIAARSGAGLILMHARGRSRDMYKDAHYASVPSRSGRSCAQAWSARWPPARAGIRWCSTPGSGSRNGRSTAMRRSRRCRRSPRSGARCSLDPRASRFSARLSASVLQASVIWQQLHRSPPR